MRDNEKRSLTYNENDEETLETWVPLHDVCVCVCVWGILHTYTNSTCTYTWCTSDSSIFIMWTIVNTPSLKFTLSNASFITNTLNIIHPYLPYSRTKISKPNGKKCEAIILTNFKVEAMNINEISVYSYVGLLHCKNRIVKITNIMVSAVARI